LTPQQKMECLKEIGGQIGKCKDGECCSPEYCRKS